MKYFLTQTWNSYLFNTPFFSSSWLPSFLWAQKKMFVFLKKEGEERPREWGTENLLQKNAPVPSSSSFTVNPFSLSFSFSLPFRSSPFFSLSFSFSLPFRSPFSFSFSFSFSLPFPFSLPFRSFFFPSPFLFRSLFLFVLFFFPRPPWVYVLSF